MMNLICTVQKIILMNRDNFIECSYLQQNYEKLIMIYIYILYEVFFLFFFILFLFTNSSNNKICLKRQMYKLIQIQQQFHISFIFILLQYNTVSYTHLRAHETRHDLVCRLLLEKKKKKRKKQERKKKKKKKKKERKKKKKKEKREYKKSNK
eukprot:TRINITY_DN9479_c0_g1_i4.p4 TRINITY_DN9479_c0_g1~~TRINITY_DN9479_c0_g1_i4.p4  ORF type:complete len:152 (-),score=44.61 TRINITY_DN9479_c0_g1_i4:48-503(-)